MARPAVPRLQLITDVVLQQRYDHAALAAMARAAGAPAVQLRHKGPNPALHVRAVADALAGGATPLSVNDHVALAAAEGASAHVGQEDAAPLEARRLIGPDALLGATVHNHAELEALIALGQPDVIDYIGVGPVYGTTSKRWSGAQLPPLGLDGLAALCNFSPWPVIAIGSVTQSRLDDVLAAGAYGVAVLSDWVLADAPERAARAWTEALARRA